MILHFGSSVVSRALHHGRPLASGDAQRWLGVRSEGGNDAASAPDRCACHEVDVPLGPPWQGGVALRVRQPKQPQARDHSEAPRPDGGPLAAAIRDELLLLGSLVVLVGIASLEAYYSAFGLRYQFIGMPSSHILYRGLTILLDAPLLLVPYTIAATWILIDRYAATDSWVMRARAPMTYVLIVVLLLGTYPLARMAGLDQARQDMVEATTSLPRVLSILLENGESFEPERGEYRLLLVSADELVVFLPEERRVRDAVPNVIHIKKSTVNTFNTAR